VQQVCNKPLSAKAGGDPGYDSGIGSPHNILQQLPPKSLPLGVNIKPKQRRRKRGSSTTVQGFHEIYELTGRLLGSGAFSRVEVCRNRRSGNEYAVKMIEKNNWYTRTRVLQEVEILYRGQGHPNIIQLEQYFEGECKFYLVFEMMRGGALIGHIESQKRFTEREAAIVLRGVACALTHLHGQGIAHRDLKFENILCGDNFTDVKICDFDLGGQKMDIPYLSTPLMDSPVGSAEFMAPEVVSLFEGHRSFYDKSCDMWSLGVLLYIMVYGKPPFTGRCGLNCGWDNGEECKECQESLFRNITLSKLTFDDNLFVSELVKDLITHLLMKDAQLRLTANEVLDHEWVKSEGNDNLLNTPMQLKRNKSSAINLGSFSTQMNEHYRRINSSQSLVASPPPSPDIDPLDKALQDIDMGVSWYEEDDIFSEDLTFSMNENETFLRSRDSVNSLSPDTFPGSRDDDSSLSPNTERSPPTPTDISDNTPVQSKFVFPEPKVNFYLSSDEEGY